MKNNRGTRRRRRGRRGRRGRRRRKAKITVTSVWRTCIFLSQKNTVSRTDRAPSVYLKMGLSSQVLDGCCVLQHCVFMQAVLGSRTWMAPTFLQGQDLKVILITSTVSHLLEFDCITTADCQGGWEIVSECSHPQPRLNECSVLKEYRGSISGNKMLLLPQTNYMISIQGSDKLWILPLVRLSPRYHG